MSPKPVCLVLIGLPASGKSTFAKSLLTKKLEPGENRWVRVNNDDIREMLFSDRIPKGKQREDLVGRVRHEMISHALSSGFNVVVDNTNLSTQVCEQARDAAHTQGASYEEKSFLYVPVNVCIARDRLREHRVGENVILGMVAKHGPSGSGARKFVMEDPTWVEPTQFGPTQAIEFNPDLPTAILVDLDGTLAIHNGRDPYDMTRVGEDLLCEPVADVVKDRHDAGDSIIVMSGRDSSSRGPTLEWLHENGVSFHHLYMRPEGDVRADDIVKAELFDQFVRGRFNVRFVLDDRDRVVRMWRRLGLKVFQVEPGNF